MAPIDPSVLIKNVTSTNSTNSSSSVDAEITEHTYIKTGDVSSSDLTARSRHIGDRD